MINTVICSHLHENIYFVGLACQDPTCWKKAKNTEKWTCTEISPSPRRLSLSHASEETGLLTRSGLLVFVLCNGLKTLKVSVTLNWIFCLIFSYLSHVRCWLLIMASLRLNACGPFAAGPMRCFAMREPSASWWWSHLKTWKPMQVDRNHPNIIHYLIKLCNFACSFNYFNSYISILLRFPTEYIKMADHYVPVPGGPNNNNYANVEMIVDIAKRIPVQVAVVSCFCVKKKIIVFHLCWCFALFKAVWAGWGHASENPKLPELLHKAGISFLGISSFVLHIWNDIDVPDPIVAH